MWQNLLCMFENEAISLLLCHVNFWNVSVLPWYFQENSNNPEKSRLASIYVRPVDIICRSVAVLTLLLELKWWFPVSPQNKLLLQCILSLFLSLCTNTCTPCKYAYKNRWPKNLSTLISTSTSLTCVSCMCFSLIRAYYFISKKLFSVGKNT